MDVPVIYDETQREQLRFHNKVNWISAICAVLVVFIHGYGITESSNIFAAKIEAFVSCNIASVAVPMFSAMSAYLFYRNFKIASLWRKLKTRFYSLAIPYLLWNTVYMLVFYVISAAPFVNREPFLLNAENAVKGILFYEYNYAYWFVFQLILFTAACPLIYALLRNRIIGQTAIVLLTAGYSCGYKSFGCMDLQFMVFYFIGAYCGMYYRKNIEEGNAIPGLGLGTFALSQALYYSVFSETGFMELTHGFLLIVAVMGIADLAADWDVPSVLRDTFPIYTLHGILLEVLNKVFSLVIPQTSGLVLIDYFLSPVLAIGMIAAGCIGFRKYFPRVFAFLFGGR